MQAEHNENSVQTHSEDALLFDLYGQAIFSYIHSRISSREDAEDLTLEVFVAALEHDNLAALPSSEHLAWLRRVAHNKLVDSYRRSQRRPRATLDFYAETLFVSEDETPEQIAMRRETQQDLQQAIERLSIQQQQLLKMRFGDGLRFTEIATLLNKREEAIRKMLSRTLTLLRDVYFKQGRR